jgi:hypothetical protein
MATEEVFAYEAVMATEAVETYPEMFDAVINDAVLAIDAERLEDAHEADMAKSA